MTSKVVAISAEEATLFGNVESEVTGRIKDVKAKADSRISACQVCISQLKWPQINDLISTAPYKIWGQ